MKRWSLVRKKIQQNLEEIIKKGNMLPIIITSNYSYQLFGKGLSYMQTFLDTSQTFLDTSHWRVFN